MIVAAYPKLYIEFKKGSEVVDDILKQVDTTFSGEIIIDEGHIHG
jgi:hypothetical protein